MKRLLSLAALVGCVFTLAACGEKEGNTTEYKNSYVLHYETLNYLKSQKANDGDVVANLVEGLVEVDYKNEIVPLGAESWTYEVTKDGKEIWTFKLRQDVKWVDIDGKEYANVTAHDYVTSAQYILNPTNASETIGILHSFIDGAKAYTDALSKGEEADFSKVGVKAVDDYTLQYTLPNPMAYFPTVLTYICFLPVNADFLKEEGINFGTDNETILYNGPYLLSEDIKNTKYTYTKNDAYYNEGIVEVEKITSLFVPDDAGADWARFKYENGELSSLKLTELDDKGWNDYVVGPDGKGTFDNPYSPSVYVNALPDKYTFHYVFNFGRFYSSNSANIYEKSAHKDNASKENTAIAIQNAEFRLGVFRGLDRTDFNAYYTPSEPDRNTRNIYTPRGLAVDDNGKDYVDYYIEYVASQTGTTFEELAPKLNDGNDYYFNEEAALAHFAKAKEELGDKVTWPVTLDILGQPSPNVYKYQKQMYDNFNARFGEYVRMNLMDATGSEEFVTYANSGNFDLNSTGWGPDYGDPLTYLDTYTTYSGGLYVYNLLPVEGNEGEGQEKLVEIRENIFGEYTKLVKEANVITDDMSARFAAFAKAEYYLLEHGLILPGFVRQYKSLEVSTAVPHTKSEAMYGLSYSKLKWIRLHGKELTAEEKANYDKMFANGEYATKFYSENKSAK